MRFASVRELEYRSEDVDERPGLSSRGASIASRRGANLAAAQTRLHECVVSAGKWCRPKTPFVASSSEIGAGKAPDANCPEVQPLRYIEDDLYRITQPALIAVERSRFGFSVRLLARGRSRAAPGADPL